MIFKQGEPLTTRLLSTMRKRFAGARNPAPAPISARAGTTWHTTKVKVEIVKTLRGPKLKGYEKRIPRSIRLEPRIKDFIEGRHGSIQAWVDLKLKEELKTTERAKNKQNKVTIDDF